MSLTLLKHEVRNHLPYVIRWDNVDPRSFRDVASDDDSDDACELWDKCVQYLDREHNPDPPPPLKTNDNKVPPLLGPFRRINLTTGEHRKLSAYFRRFTITVDHSDSESSDAEPAQRDQDNASTVNIRKIPSSVLSWRACETQDGLIARPAEVKNHWNNTRDASYVLFRSSTDNNDITGRHPAPNSAYSYYFGQLTRLISVKFAGHTHALAYVNQYKTSTEDPGLQKRNGLGFKVTIVRALDILELIGMIKKHDGSLYFCAHGTAIHHFDHSDFEGGLDDD